MDAIPFDNYNVYKLDRDDLDEKLQALINFANEHCNPKEDLLNMTIAWDLDLSQDDPRKTIHVFWTFLTPTENNDDMTPEWFEYQKNRVNKLDMFLKQYQFEKVYIEVEPTMAFISIK